MQKIPDNHVVKYVYEQIGTATRENIEGQVNSLMEQVLSMDVSPIDRQLNDQSCAVICEPSTPDENASLTMVWPLPSSGTRVWYGFDKGTTTFYYGQGNGVELKSFDLSLLVETTHRNNFQELKELVEVDNVVITDPKKTGKMPPSQRRPFYAARWLAGAVLAAGALYLGYKGFQALRNMQNATPTWQAA